MQTIKTREIQRNIKVLDKSMTGKVKNTAYCMKAVVSKENVSDDNEQNQYAVNKVLDKAETNGDSIVHRISHNCRKSAGKPEKASENLPKEQFVEYEQGKKYVKEKLQYDLKQKHEKSTMQSGKENPLFYGQNVDKTMPNHGERVRDEYRHFTKSKAHLAVQGNPLDSSQSIKVNRNALKISLKSRSDSGRVIKSNSALNPQDMIRGMQASNSMKQRFLEKMNHTVQTVAKGSAKILKDIVSSIRGSGALVAVGGGVLLIFICIILMLSGILSLNHDGNSTSVSKVSEKVKAYEPLITQYAAKHGIPEYAELIKAVMMQESGGNGTDPMQASECGFNKNYPNIPNGIKKPEYSIDVGVQNLAACLQGAGAKSPIDMEHINTALQGYNFGNGYISWVKKEYGSYSPANAIEFSEMMQKRLGTSGYGDVDYVPHVLRYYPLGNMPMGTGSGAIVQMALTQEGNVGGRLYWSWYGFTNRVEWCACFVSWCADRIGYIDTGIIPKFAACVEGANWFKGKGQWQGRGYIPSAGDIIFFDWNGSGVTHHVGIVESVADGMVNTIEGNSGDMCRQRSYLLTDEDIYGYGIPKY